MSTTPTEEAKNATEAEASKEESLATVNSSEVQAASLNGSAKEETSTVSPTKDPVQLIKNNPNREKIPPPEGMTKSAYKKLLRQQAWDAGREERQEQRRQRSRELRQKRKEQAKCEKKRKREEEEEASGISQPEEKKKRIMEDITIILDCSFDDKMLDKEVNSLSSQITRCHSANKNSTHQVQLKLTSHSGRLKDRMDNLLKGNHKHWKNFEVTTEDYEVNENTIYLTAESETTLEVLEPGKSYIVGGIVDKNRYKGLCDGKARRQGLKTAKLPIGDYIEMSTRHILTTNQVVEIMLKWLELKDWKEAFLAVIPQRKLPGWKEGGSVAGSEKNKADDAAEDEQENSEEEYDVEDAKRREAIAERAPEMDTPMEDVNADD